MSFEGITEFLGHARSLTKEAVPILTDAAGNEWSREKLELLRPPTDKATFLRVGTLTALCDLLLLDETVAAGRTMVVHVVSPGEVTVYSPMNARRERETVVMANALLGQEITGWKSLFDFNLAILTGCVDDAERAKLLEYTGNVKASEVFTVVDDGVSQSASVAKGIAANVVREAAPTVVTLRPFRSFVEVEQVPSPFVLRMRNNRNEDIEVGVFECDGHSWMIQQMEKVGEFLRSRLDDHHTVIW